MILSLGVLLARQPTPGESLRLARVLTHAGRGPMVMPVVGQLVRSTVSPKGSYYESMDHLVVVHRAAPRSDGEQLTLATVADADMVLIGMFGTTRGSQDEGTFVACPTAGRSEAEANEAVRLALAAIKAEMPRHLDSQSSCILWPDCPTPIVDFVKAEMRLLWEDHVYDLYTTDKAPTKFGVGMGSSWVDEETGETFVIDIVRRSDFELMLANLYKYDPEYLEFITQTYPFTELNCMIRAYPKGADPTTASHEQGEPAAWASTHYDLSIAGLTTMERFRRRKLAAKGVEVVSHLQIEFMRKHFPTVFDDGAMPPLSFGMVKDGNDASVRTMKGCGFSKLEGVRFQWIGIKLSSV